MMKNLEKYYPIIISIVLLVVSLIFKGIVKDAAVMVDKVGDNALVIAVTFLGFLLTILTIINSIETRRMRFIKEGGVYPLLIGYLNVAIKGNIALIALSFLVKYVDYRNFKMLWIQGVNVIDYGYLFYFVFSLLLSYRFTAIFVKLLSDPTVD